ncbi:MAG: aldose 1-epimerase [Candidatus Borkfalkiaceae bacterium]|nr:aldose 1-epimerase [Christensenellaceae bacterium]
MKEISIENKKYKAVILPEFGGNCVRLTERISGAELLRFPDSEERMKNTPLLFGMPLLLPPNRISGGKFTFRGREYVLPINEPEINNHCHGELYKTPFTDYSVSADSVTFRFFSREDNRYLGFLHDFSFELTYSVDDNGLTQTFSIKNESGEVMPFALAFHTTLNLAFEGGNPDEYSLYLPVSCDFERNMKNFIPTGKIFYEFEEKEELNQGKWKPSLHAITKSVKAENGKAVITHDKTGNTLVYECDPLYGYRHIFNGGNRDFICIEPQTCRIDGLNVWKDEKKSGVIAINGGESVKLVNRLYFIDNSQN